MCVEFATNSRKVLGYAGEDLVRQYYLSHGYVHIVSNYTIRGGELDLVFVHGLTVIFVEVKVINFVDDIHDYVTAKKLYYLNKTIDSFLLSSCGGQYFAYERRLDVAFVRGSDIVEVFESVSL